MNGLRVTAFGMTQTLYATNQRFPEDSADYAVDLHSNTFEGGDLNPSCMDMKSSVTVEIIDW